MQSNQTEKEASKACEKQVKEYEKCLTSFSSYTTPGYYWTYCRGPQWDLKHCSDFDKWLEQTVSTQSKGTK